MIKNDKQLAITKTARQKFIANIELLKSFPKSIKNQILINQAESQVETFDAEIREYKWLKQDKPSIITASISELPEILIKARIIKDLSQEELANKIGVKAQQIQRYEASNYETASFDRIIGIARCMGLQFEETRIFIAESSIELQHYNSQFIQQATQKLHSRKGLLSI